MSRTRRYMVNGPAQLVWIAAGERSSNGECVKGKGREVGEAGPGVPDRVEPAVKGWETPANLCWVWLYLTVNCGTMEAWVSWPGGNRAQPGPGGESDYQSCWLPTYLLSRPAEGSKPTVASSVPGQGSSQEATFGCCISGEVRNRGWFAACLADECQQSRVILPKSRVKNLRS